MLLKLGEIVLKGGNRRQFERMLQGNIRRALRDLGIAVRIWQRDGVIILRVPWGAPAAAGRPLAVAALDVPAPDPPALGVPAPAPDPRALDVPAPALDAAASGRARGSADHGSADHGVPASPAGMPYDAGAAADQVAQRARDVMGVARVCRAVRVAKDPGAAVEAAVAMMAGRPGSFAVRPRRRDKRFPLTSAELAIEIGSRVQQAYGYPVNLSRPDTTLFVEVDQHEVFVYTEGHPGQGGLPVGMSGRALVLMSGGIDSPVAGYRMMRRGLRCDFLHFSGMPLTGPESVYKAYGLMHQLNRFQGRSRLFVVAFGRAQQRLASSGASRLQIVAQRRLMLRTGEVLARRLGASALVTGDSLGQVSSQTLANIAALDDAVKLPILRPLIGADKTEIMAEARRIRTLALSELPDQDCCTLLTPRHVETRARVDDLRRIEARLDAADLAEELAGLAQEYRPDNH